MESGASAMPGGTGEGRRNLPPQFPGRRLPSECMRESVAINREAKQRLTWIKLYEATRNSDLVCRHSGACGGCVGLTRRPLFRPNEQLFELCPCAIRDRVHLRRRSVQDRLIVLDLVDRLLAHAWVHVVAHLVEPQVGASS